MGHLQSNHEEAYTKIILHAVDATDNDDTELSIYSPDIDVLLIAVRRYPEIKPRQAESDKLPPANSKAALHQGILRAHYPLMV